MLCGSVYGLGISRENSSDVVMVFIDWLSSKQEKKRVVNILVWQEQIGASLCRHPVTGASWPGIRKSTFYTQKIGLQKKGSDHNIASSGRKNISVSGKIYKATNNAILKISPLYVKWFSLYLEAFRIFSLSLGFWNFTRMWLHGGHSFHSLSWAIRSTFQSGDTCFSLEIFLLLFLW